MGRTARHMAAGVLAALLAVGATATGAGAGVPQAPTVELVGTPAPGRVLPVSGEGCIFQGARADYALVSMDIKLPSNPHLTRGFQINMEIAPEADGTFAGEFPIPANAPPALYELLVGCVFDDVIFIGPVTQYQVEDLPPPQLSAPDATPAGTTMQIAGSGCVIDGAVLEMVRVRVYDTPIDQIIGPGATRITVGGGTVIAEAQGVVGDDGTWALDVVLPDRDATTPGRIEARCTGEAGTLQVEADLTIEVPTPTTTTTSTTTPVSTTAAPAAAHTTPRFTG